MVTDTEAAWLEQALKGDDEAYSRLVETYQNPVFNLCYRMLGDEAEAEDAAQEAFWRAYQALKRYDPNRSFITWLLSIAAHYCIDQQRKRRFTSFSIDSLEEDFLPDGGMGPEKAAAQSEQSQALHQMLAQMPAPDRAAIVLRYWYDFTDQEIADALSLTVPAVKSRLHRARRALAEQMQQHIKEPAYAERNPYESSAL